MKKDYVIHIECTKEDADKIRAYLQQLGMKFTMEIKYTGWDTK